jgi:hypothetical protein
MDHKLAVHADQHRSMASRRRGRHHVSSTPANVLAIASPALAGTGTAFIPASRLNFSTPKCVSVPTPVEPNFSSPGFAFAVTINPLSCRDARPFGCNQHVGLACERSDRNEVIQGVTGQILQEGGAVRLSAGVDEQRVTVSWRVRDQGRGRCAPAPGWFSTVTGYAKEAEWHLRVRLKKGDQSQNPPQLPPSS